MADSLTDEEPLQSLKIGELKEQLQRRGIKISGKKKADLIKRYTPLLYYDW